MQDTVNTSTPLETWQKFTTLCECLMSFLKVGHYLYANVHKIVEFFQTFTSVSITRSKHREHVHCFLFLLDIATNKRKQLVFFDHQNVNCMFPSAIVTSTARACSVFLSSQLWKHDPLPNTASIFLMVFSKDS